LFLLAHDSSGTGGMCEKVLKVGPESPAGGVRERSAGPEDWRGPGVGDRPLFPAVGVRNFVSRVYANSLDA